MILHMNDAKLTTLDQIRAFLSGTAEVAFTPAAEDAARYADIVGVLRRFRYSQLKRSDKGLLLRYLRIVSGYSRQQVTRLVAQCVDTGKIEQHYRAPQAGFTRKYTDEDVRLLADLDVLHGTLSGPATKCLMQRAYHVFNDIRFVRLQHISVAQLYNLRKRRSYQAVRVTLTKTRSTTLKIGVRRAPRPEGLPGYIRIDSVHQGDLDGIKGLYYINAVDCITQWELVASCEKISEAFLLPVLKQLLDGFPFVLHGFHADNGSEYVNQRVAEMLNKLNLEFTRSRPRTSNDNGLAETKNGAIIRKQFGYAHIPQRYATQVNAVCAEHLNPYLNFHRPCLFATETQDAKGKINKHYLQKHIMTPFDKLKSIDAAATILKPGITLENLDAIAVAMTDNQSAERLKNAKAHLFRTINSRSRPAA
jgi:hypothetical protein